MEKILDSELTEIQEYYQQEAEKTATIGRLTTEYYLLQDRINEIQDLLDVAQKSYVDNNKQQFTRLQTLLKKYGSKEVNTITGELTK